MGRFTHLETTQPAAPAAGERPVAVEPYADLQPELIPDSLDMDAAGCLRQGDLAFFRGDHKVALRWYSRAIDKESRFLEPWIMLVRALMLHGDLQEGYTWIGRGLTVFPQSPALLALRAVNYARRGMLRQAMNNSDAVLEQHPNEVQASIARGEVLVLAENKNADYCFEQALKQTAPNDWKTPLVIGLICEERRLWARAIGYYAQAAQRNERVAALWYHVGLCRSELGQRQLAEKAFEQAGALCTPDDPLQARLQQGPGGSFWKYLTGLFRRRR